MTWGMNAISPRPAGERADSLSCGGRILKLNAEPRPGREDRIGLCRGGLLMTA
jgi:hypothetical protein